MLPVDGGKAKKVTYQGVVIPGWGGDCGCGPGESTVALPFALGAYWYSSLESVNGKRITLVRGGSVEIGI